VCLLGGYPLLERVQPFWPFIALLLVNKQKQPADKANTIARRKSGREINQWKRNWKWKGSSVAISDKRRSWWRWKSEWTEVIKRVALECVPSPCPTHWPLTPSASICVCAPPNCPRLKGVGVTSRVWSVIRVDTLPKRRIEWTLESKVISNIFGKFPDKCQICVNFWKINKE